MAVIPAFPSQAVIDKLAGVIDYYVHFGQPCVRMYPRWKNKPRSPAVQKGWGAFTYANQIASDLPPKIIDTWKRLASGTSLAWKDWLIRCYIGATFNPQGYAPTMPDWENQNHFLITNFYVGESYWDWSLYIITDVPVILAAAKIAPLPRFIPVWRNLRGAQFYKDKQLVYKGYSYESEDEWSTPKLKHVFRQSKWSRWKYGTFFIGNTHEGIFKSISQYFLQEDFHK